MGGIKVIRALLIQKGLRWHVSKVFMSKNTIKAVKFNGKLLLPAEMNSELAKYPTFYPYLYLVYIYIYSGYLVFHWPPDYSLADAIFESSFSPRHRWSVYWHH